MAKELFFRFTLYSAYIMVSKGNLMLRQFVAYSSRNFRNYMCGQWRTQRRAKSKYMYAIQKNEINKKKQRNKHILNSMITIIFNFLMYLVA